MVGFDCAKVLTTSLNRELKQRPRQRERKKAVGLDGQSNNFTRSSFFFLPHFTFCRGREHKKIISFSVFNLDKVSYSVKLQKNSPKFDKFNGM